MNRVKQGFLLGLIFALLDALLMLPLDLPDKTVAITGASINRFAIGFLVPIVILPLPRWVVGLLIGTLLSLPDAIITNTYVPILGVGALGGLIIGLISQKIDK